METSLLIVFVTIYKLRRVWQYTAALAALAAIVTTTHMVGGGGSGLRFRF